jgi:hypothetical protein
VRHCPKCGADYADAIAFCPSDGSETLAAGAGVAGKASARDPLIGVIVDGRYRIEERIG